MRIAWFTPFRKVSAIGRFSRIVTECLARHAHVDLWVADADSDALHHTTLRVVRYPPLVGIDGLLREYDLIVYNMGDHGPNHSRLYEVSQRVPGVVILHDYVLHHFLVSYYAETGAWDRYSAVLRRRYGLEIHWDGTGWSGRDCDIIRKRDCDEVIGYPLFEEVLTGCVGVVTHAEFVREAVAGIGIYPVTKIPLAYNADCGKTVRSRQELDIPADRVLVVTTGNPNENKRIHIVLQALAADRALADSIFFVVIGDCEAPFAQSLQRLRKDLHLNDTVRFTGYASDDVLRSYLAHAGFCVNLRWPAMEGGSASCAEQMLYGKPAIVTETGVYKELPDTCVRRVRPEYEIEDLTRHLRDLAADADLRLSMGEQARQFAESNFSPDEYARRFLAFATELASYRPALHLIETVGRELRRIGVSSDMAILDMVAREAALLLDGDCDPPILRKENHAETRERTLIL